MKRFIVPVLAVLLGACGFQPLYQQNHLATGESSVLDQVWIKTIPGASGLALRNNLVDQFYKHGTPENPAYTLKINLYETSRSLAIQKNDTTTRAQLVLNADYQLINNKTGATIDSGRMRTVSSYNILTSQYTTIVTLDAGRRQGLEQLADKLTQRTVMMLQK